MFMQLIDGCLKGGAGDKFGQTMSCATPVAAASWFFYAMTSDGSSVTMYLYHEGGHFTHDFVIGDVQPLAQSPNMVFGGLRDVHDGTVRDDSYPPGNPSPPKSGFDGYLDETQYWNAKLTADEIATVYNGGNPVGDGFEMSLSADLQAKLVSWWRFGDGDTFPAITDKVGPNHLTMSHKNAPDPIDANDIVELPPAYCFADRDALLSALQDWCNDPQGAEGMYGHVSTWCVSLVTAMNGLVNNANTACVNTFNDDISAWDVSAVSTFDQMFYTATAFDQDLSAWDVSTATSAGSMHHTFYGASALSDCNKRVIYDSWTSQTGAWHATTANNEGNWGSLCQF